MLFGISSCFYNSHAVFTLFLVYSFYYFFAQEIIPVFLIFKSRTICKIIQIFFKNLISWVKISYLKLFNPIGTFPKFVLFEHFLGILLLSKILNKVDHLNTLLTLLDHLFLHLLCFIDHFLSLTKTHFAQFPVAVLVNI